KNHARSVDAGRVAAPAFGKTKPSGDCALGGELGGHTRTRAVLHSSGPRLQPGSGGGNPVGRLAGGVRVPVEKMGERLSSAFRGHELYSQRRRLSGSRDAAGKLRSAAPHRG